MLNKNITQRGNQATGLDVMIVSCSPDSHHVRSDRNPANIGSSFFRYTNEDLRNLNNQIPKGKKWTREDNKLSIHCYFRSNRTQRGYRKRMIEIWLEFSSFRTTSKRKADRVRTIIRKGWFYDLEILEIKQIINNGQDCNAISDTPSINKQNSLT